MTPGIGPRLPVPWFVAVLMLALPAMAPGQEAGHDPAAVRVAKWIYANGRAPVCFSDQFLATVERRSPIRVERELKAVGLDSDAVFDFPLAVMSGERAFSLPEDQSKRLAAYLERGGFLLASAGCSDQQWASSFVEALARAMPEAELKPLPMDHPIFHTIFEIERVLTRKRFEGPAIYGIAWRGRLVGLYSPIGLNDTANAGGGCCCCGGNEIRNASLINANVLAYVLTR